jgi:myo-inositol-1(or 4)-monophosphatase
MATRSPVINVIAGTVVKAARVINRDFGEISSLQSSESEKGPEKFVSAALRKSGEILAKELQRSRRGFSYFQHGAAPIEGESGFDNAWLVKPIDGLENFRRGLPGFATVIGVRERGAITAAAVYDPLRDELFWADRGTGCYANHQRIRVTGRGRLDDAMLAVDGTATHGGMLLAASGAALRQTGTASLDFAYVAAGRFDGAVAVGLDDIVSEVGGFLVREAGGLLSKVSPSDDKDAPDATVASGARLDRALRNGLNQALSGSPAA